MNKSKIIEQNEIKLESKQKQIDKLNTEIKNLKSGKTLLEKDKIIENQNLIIKEKDDTIKYQNNIIESLKEETYKSEYTHLQYKKEVVYGIMKITYYTYKQDV